MLTCDKIDLLEEIANGSYVMRVTLSDGRTPLWIYDQTEAAKFLNKEVIVEIRKDIYKGEMQDFIATFTVPTVVHTLPATEAIKLYVDQQDNQSNVAFSEIAIGEQRAGCLVFCTHSEMKSSNAATWQELVIRDRTMHTAKLRLFDYENSSADFSGKYVMCALSRSKFGFQTDKIAPATGEVAENPEITIAENYIKNFFAQNVSANQYMEQTQLLHSLHELVDYEMGYGLMRMAMELAMVNGMDNITKDVDLITIGEAILCSYGHLTKHSVLSSVVNNIVLAMNFNWHNKALMLQILDVQENDEEVPPEVAVYKSIKSTVSTILEVRKGSK